MSFKEGKFYVIQGKSRDGAWVFLESLKPVEDPRARLRAIAKRTRPTIGHGWDEDDDDSFGRPNNDIRVSDNPFAVKHFADCNFSIAMTHMRAVRANCGISGIDPNSLRLTIVETSVKVFEPEPESSDAIEMRRFALEKLSDSEKELLKVKHWDVYHKLGDRSMLDDDEDDNA